MKSNKEMDLMYILGMDERIKHLEYKMGLMRQFLDPRQHTFIYLCLESNLTEKQVNAIYDLIEGYQKEIRRGRDISPAEIERDFRKIIPEQGDYHFAENVISSLNEEGRYEEVYKALKKSGMNI